jgi:hypothetical protein
VKGCNTLLINQATAVDALQHYVTNVLMRPAMRVTSVAQYDDDGFSEGLKVQLEEFDKSPKATP